MVTQDQIDHAVRILIQEASPVQIILFGSYARGDARPESDVDLLVVERKVVNQRREMARLRQALSPLRIPVDVLVTTPERIQSSWGSFPGGFLYDALREGKVVYAVDRAGRTTPA